LFILDSKKRKAEDTKSVPLISKFPMFVSASNATHSKQEMLTMPPSNTDQKIAKTQASKLPTDVTKPIDLREKLNACASNRISQSSSLSVSVEIESKYRKVTVTNGNRDIIKSDAAQSSSLSNQTIHLEYTCPQLLPEYRPVYSKVSQ